MIKHLILSTFSLMAATLSILAQHPSLPLRDLPSDDLAFAAGEKAVYTVHYKWGAINTDVATGHLTTESASYKGQAAYKCRLYGRTAKFYDSFFKVREDFCAWISTDHLRPLRYTRDVREGGYYANDEYSYDHGAKLINARLNNKKKGEREVRLPLEEGMTSDFITEMFRIRHMDFDRLTPGGLYSYNLANGSKVSPLLIKYKGLDSKKVKGLGTVESHRFVITLSGAEQFAEGAEMQVWISNDDNRLIVAMETPIRVGNIVARLSSYEGLRHPFAALQ